MKKIIITSLLTIGLVAQAFCADQATPEQKAGVAVGSTTTMPLKIAIADKTDKKVSLFAQLGKHISSNYKLYFAANPVLSTGIGLSLAIPIALFVLWLSVILGANGVLFGNEVWHRVMYEQEMFKETEANDEHKKLILHYPGHDTDDKPILGFSLFIEGIYLFLIPGLMMKALAVHIEDFEQKIKNKANDEAMKKNKKALEDKKFMKKVLLIWHYIYIIMACLAVPALMAILLVFFVPVGLIADAIIVYKAYKKMPQIQNKNLGGMLLNACKNFVARFKAARDVKRQVGVA